ncbi:MAG: hypothetical protein JRN52_04650 [Nitrososphaerota archaeon]|nr:hypothetical protein [Nitrososphaerota archaeon]
MKSKSAEEISAVEAIHAVVHGSQAGLERRRFPQIDLMILLDILGALSRSGEMSPKQLANSSASKPDRHTLHKYVKILLDFGFVTVKRISYHGVVRSKHLIEVTERGNEFLLACGRIFKK